MEYPQSFAFLITVIPEISREVCKFLKKVDLFLTYSIVSECLQTNFLHMSHAYSSKSKRCFNVNSSTYSFHVKTKIFADFQVLVSVN